MDERLRTWAAREVAGWKPLDEAPQIKVPEAPRRSPQLADHLSEAEIDAGPPIDDDVLTEFPWDLEERGLLSMDWGNGMPGLSGGYSILAVDVPGVGTLYLEVALFGWALLASAESKGDPPAVEDADRVFLDLALRTNGEAFGTELIGSAPHSLSIGVSVSTDWIVDRLMCVFDGREVWDSLLEEFPFVWLPGYESPLEEHEVLGYGEAASRAEREFEESTPEPRSFIQHHSYRRMKSERIREAVDRTFVPIHEIPERDDRMSDRNRWRMLERYVSVLLYGGTPSWMSPRSSKDV